jgi:hypothetical protein
MAIIYGTVTLVVKITNFVYPVNYIYDNQYYDTNNTKTMPNQSGVNTDIQMRNAQNTTLREIFTAMAVIIVSLPLYSYHWAMAQKERKKEEV